MLTHNFYNNIGGPFTLTTIYLLLALVDNGRQLNLPRGNFNDSRLGRAKVKNEL